VSRLAADLKNAGLDVWYDVSGLSGGSRWRLEIEKAIRNSEFLIVVLSPDSITSEWVEREFLFAENLERKIIPLMYRFCELPLNYLDLNYIDMQGEKYQYKFPELLHALSIDSSEITLASSKQKKLRLTAAYSLLALSVFVIIGVAFWGLPGIGNWVSLIPVGTSTSTEVPTIPTEIDYPPYIFDEKGIELVLIPADFFTMGSGDDNAFADCRKIRSDCQSAWFKDESPSQVQWLESFYIDKFEVSNASYRACVTDGTCRAPRNISSQTRSHYYDDEQFSDYPAIYVDWNMALAYCEWRGGHLPTEAQWEKASRGTNGLAYPWGNVFNETAANFCDRNCNLVTANHQYDDGYRDTAPVNSYDKQSNQYGLLNMSGNVYEWVMDLYDPYPGTDENASPYFGKGYRVIRGGSWSSSVDSLRTSNRDPRPSEEPGWDIGFRCVKDVDP
jgi:formylglycine-generating enzyme required for sulfatase activity